MRWIAYIGGSSSREIPGVCVMRRGVPVKVENEEKAAELLASPMFREVPPGGPAAEPEAGEREG